MKNTKIKIVEEEVEIIILDYFKSPYRMSPGDAQRHSKSLAHEICEKLNL